MSEKFGDKLKELEKISLLIEKDDIDLEESFELFDQGMKIANECEKKLKSYQKKIEIIKKENN